MKKSKLYKSLPLLILSLTGLLMSCSNVNNGGTNTGGQSDVSNNSDEFSDKDTSSVDVSEYDVAITLSSNSIACDDTTRVSVNNNVATIIKKGTYLITGSIADGYIVVDAADENVTLILSDASITSKTFAGIYVANAKNVYVVLDGNNTVSNTNTFTQIDSNNVDGAIFSKDDLIFKGNGSLTVKSSDNGIVGKDDVKFIAGAYNITASKGHGIDVNESCSIADASLTINSGIDGVHVENDEGDGYFYMESGTINITSTGDGISACYYLKTIGGTIDITSGGGSNKTASSSTSSKGLKCTSEDNTNGGILVSGGTFTLNCSDDAIHSNGTVLVTGGTFTIASNDDGMHADDYLTISNGTINITKSYEGLEATYINISGGDIDVVASDDGLNAAGGNDGSGWSTSSTGQLNISGGDIYVNCSGDGLDANGTLTMSGGSVFVEGPTGNDNGALDYDSSAKITGGVLCAIGSSGMAMNFSSATQGSILLNSASGSSNTKITCGSYSWTASKSFSSVVVSTPEMSSASGTYTVTVGSQSYSCQLSSYLYGSSTGTPGGNGNPGGGGGPGGHGW